MPIDVIDLSRCMPFKDFGKGFYTTTIKEQACNMAHRTTAIQGNGMSTVTAFELDPDWRNKSLRILEFEGASPEWATFIINNRNRRFEDTFSPLCNHENQYDIVVGPVANDRIVASFHLYADGFISLDELVERLRYRKLNDQYSFHTERAVALLEHKGVVA